jgi:hypothetical protein
MYLFIDTLSHPNFIALFDTKRNIIDSETWTGKQQEFDTLIEKIDALLSKNLLPYRGLSGIVVIVWPGSFTWTRVTTLVANTLGFSFDIPLFPLSVRDFFALQNAPLPWITAITKKEALLWNTDNLEPVIVEIHQLPHGRYSTLGTIDLDHQNHTIYLASDHSKVITHVVLERWLKRVHPLYAKDPNITPIKIPHAQ